MFWEFIKSIDKFWLGVFLLLLGTGLVSLADKWMEHRERMVGVCRKCDDDPEDDDEGNEVAVALEFPMDDAPSQISYQYSWICSLCGCRYNEDFLGKSIVTARLPSGWKLALTTPNTGQQYGNCPLVCPQHQNRA